jgi:hypothetical protein
MEKDKIIWSGRRIMDRWRSSPTELASFIYQGLRAFRMKNGNFHEVKHEEVNNFDDKNMTDLLFRPVDIEEFEKRAS